MPCQGRAVRLLSFTNLYPNAVQATHGLFVERRLQRLVAERGVEAVVIAPIPYIPPPFGYLRTVPKYSGISRVEERAGVSVFHPRFLAVPGLSRFIAPFTMALASLSLARRLAREGRCDIVDAHYFYPDGVAAAFVAKILGKPLVITARGTDINVLPAYRFSRWLIRWSAGVAARIITVSEALRTKLIELGVSPEKITTLRNGVDTDEFVFADRADARRAVALPDGLILLSVGNLIVSKGHHLVIEALRDLTDAHLVIVGGGEYRAELERLAERLGVAQRVRFTGTLPPAEIVRYYNAADLLLLASEREGMPNVVLEALSCGLPVLAADCGGVAEIVNRPELGRLLRERNAAAIAQGVRDLLAEYPDRRETRASALSLGWGATIRKQTALYRDLVAERPATQ
jgi:teichuronic acid biosynthesis glycosyltransferase TuaC